MKRVQAFLSREAPVKWLFYGDSITHGARHTYGGRDYTETFDERLRFELGRRLDVILNTAISGNTTDDLLASYDWRVKQFAPDVVFIMIGMNDCDAGRHGKSPEPFRANLRALCDRLAADGALAVLQTTCPIIPGLAPSREPYFPAIMQIIRDVAAERELPLIDHTAHWLEQDANTFQYWMNNAFHPNTHGHLAFARLIFRELGIWDPETSIVCKFFIP
jgi:lysophospholipase L1-like esterase